VKLLFDENLSRKLVERLSDLFPGSTHVAFVGLLKAPDIEIWEHAKVHGYAIVTADAVFYQIATTLGPPPKVVWLRECDYPMATGKSLEECRRNLAGVLEDWLFFSISKGLPIPPIGAWALLRW
jgi:predicted nuclease of predicted toxin-antitoxin system